MGETRIIRGSAANGFTRFALEDDLTIPAESQYLVYGQLVLGDYDVTIEDDGELVIL
jgi:hypothetical protein